MSEAQLDIQVYNLFTHLERGFDIYKYNKLHTMCKYILIYGRREDIRDFITMVFYTRDIRGMGEKSLGISMFNIIFKYCPELANLLIPIIPHYGSWKDMWKLYETPSETPSLIRDVIDLVVIEQFRRDQESDEPSLLAKYLPREGGARDALAKHFADILFPKVLNIQGLRMRAYRKTVSYLNGILDTTEVKMCGNSWATINPARVPIKLMARNKKAFLNESRINNEDRIDCARKFHIHMGVRIPHHTIYDSSNEEIKKILDSSRYDKVREALV